MPLGVGSQGDPLLRSQSALSHCLSGLKGDAAKRPCPTPAPPGTSHVFHGVSSSCTSWEELLILSLLP